MAFITAPTLRVKGIQWTLDRPASVNVSAYSGQRTAALSPWHGKWTAHVDLAAIQGESAFRTVRSFIAKCKGSLSTFYLPATVEVQNANASVTVSVAASAGATGLAITGYTTALTEGQYFTVNGQLCCCTADQVVDSLAFEPALREDAAVGTVVETANPYAIVYMANTQSGWNITPGRMFGLSFDVVEAVKERPPLFFDTFTDPASTNMRLRGRVQNRVLFGYQPVPAKWRTFCGVWGADGNGYAYPTSVVSDTSNMLSACLLAPAGTAGDRKITVVLNANASDRPRIVVSTDGRYFITVEYTSTSAGFRIRQLDAHAFSPTYSTTGGNAWTDLATGTMTGYVNTDDQTFTITLAGSVVTALHVNTGVTITGTATVPIGPEFGIAGTNATAKFRSVKVESVGATSLFALGNGVNLVDMRTIQWAGDCDGMSMGDLNGDGLSDLVYGVSGNGNGVIGGVYMATQSPADVWTTAPILVNSSISVTDKWNGVEGVCIVPINGANTHVFVNDTPSQGQWLVEIATGNRLQLSTNNNGQDARILTINGEQIIVATYEGGTISNGGIVGYRYLGGNALTLANWQIFPIVIRPGAWAFSKSNFGFVDLNGDGGQWLVYGARDNGNTAVTAPGFYSVKMPVSPFAGSWAETALFVAPDGTDVINWDFGDFSGDGNGLDIGYVVLNTQAAPKYLRKSTSWTSTATLTLGVASTNHAYNFGKMPVRGTGTRDGFWCWVSFQGFYHVYWNGSAWAKQLFHGDNWDHGTNGCNQPYRNRGDGSYSIYLGNSFSNDLLEMRVR